jgi:dihydroneopterin aldolase
VTIVVELEALVVFGRHGVLEEERERGQRFLYDVRLEVSDAALSDRIEDAVDYRQVADCVREVSDGRTFSLIETLAAAVADAIVERFPVERVRVRVRKPDIDLPVEFSAATVERGGRWAASRYVGAAAVIVDSEGRVLLVRHTYGRLNWELPGGLSEPGESFVETALRELREETGLRGVPERLTGIYYDPDEDAHHLVFRCAVVDGAAPAPSSPEISDCAWFAADALPHPTSDFTARRIQDALAGGPPALPDRASYRARRE